MKTYKTPLCLTMSLLSCALLSGCGGSSNSTPADAASISKSDTPTSTADNYTVTDLGAADYYYGYYGYINNYGRYGGLIHLNDNAQIVSGGGQKASVYYNGTSYKISDTYYSAALGLNNKNQVVGYGFVNGGDGTASLWDNGVISNIGALPGGYGTATAINDAGQVAGSSSRRDDPTSYYWWVYHAYLWQNSVFTDIGTLGGSYSYASSINGSGAIVGWSTLSDPQGYYYGGPVHAFVYQAGKLTDLGLLPDGSSSDASDVNDSGQIVGSGDTTPQGLYRYRPLHATTWINGQISDLGTLGGPGSIAYALNNAGVIVGSADTSRLAPTPPPYYAYYGYGNYGGGGGIGNNSGGGNTSGSTGNGNGGSGTGNPIGAGAGSSGSQQRSIKASGKTRAAQTRGIGDTYVSHAFVTKDGKMLDLNTQIPSSLGWELMQATDVNNKGQIVGFGTFGNHLHAFLLTPK